MKNRAELVEKARAVLVGNDRGGYTVPSPTLYPHQWNWDSAFCVLGFMHFDPRRAARELEMLVRGQWDSGMIPHITFNPDAEHYEPGPAMWETIGAPGAPTNVRVSSITQPPIAATAARKLLDCAGGDAEIEAALRDRVLPALDRWHEWFARDRDPAGSGVPCIMHPWESGMDNAPRWDAALARIDPGDVRYVRKDDTIVDASQRPQRADYDRYFFLVKHRKKRGFAPAERGADPFLVEDVAMASILCRAERDLSEVAQALGLVEVASRAGARRARLEEAIAGRLFDPAKAVYFDVDVTTGKRIEGVHVAHWLPIFAGIAPPNAVRLVVQRLADPTAFGPAWPVPTVRVDDPKFEPQRYWRGPTWINVNWMLVDGLAAAGEANASRALAEKTLDLVSHSGFYEYFHPQTGAPLGASSFAWTAALAIDLAARA